MIRRSQAMRAVRSALANNPVCVLLGPRQCGKTTLARELAKPGRSHYFDLESAVGSAVWRIPSCAVVPRGSRGKGHPKYGASWEGFALEQVLAVTGARQAFCWGTHAGAELDLLLIAWLRDGIEFKAAAAPSMTKSLHVALTDLKLERAWIVHPGNATYPLHECSQATSLTGVMKALARLAKSKQER